MTVPPYVIVIVLIIFGFLTGATIFFYDQSRVGTVNHATSQKVTFSGTVPQPNTNTPQNQALAALTKPDAPKNRLSYPTNIYVVQPKETLFGIATKFGLPRQLIIQANGLSNENVIQANLALVIPANDPDADLYRINMTLNDTVSTTLNQQLRTQPTSDYLDPVKVAQKDGIPYFGTSSQDSFTLGEQDLSKGTAVVQVKNGGTAVAVIGLFQPKVKGPKGIWAVLYVEQSPTL